MNMEKNENINLKTKIENLKVTNVNINGEGVCAYKGYKVCVNGSLEGEEVTITPNFIKGNFIRGTLEQITEPSSLREKEPCKYCNKCGGCNLQFVNYENSLNIKKQILQKFFEDLFSGEIKVTPSKNNFNYRNKASFFVKNGKVGFQKEGTNEVVEIDNCLILEEELNRALIIFKNWLKSNKTQPINHFVVRVLEGKLSVVVVSTAKIKNLQNLALALKNEFGEGNFGLYENINTNKKVIMSNNFNLVYGLNLLQTSFNNIKYFIHPNSFMQVNNHVKNELYNAVLENINNQDVVIEGYSGAGLLSALMATKAKQVFSVEINKDATSNANLVKKQNNITNLNNINGDCKTCLPEIIKNNPNATFVIDPARSGVDVETLQAVKNANIKKIIYVSCNPYTLKQNIVFLGENYKIKSMQFFDMFPQTFHTETLTIIERV